MSEPLSVQDRWVLGKILEIEKRLATLEENQILDANLVEKMKESCREV